LPRPKWYAAEELAKCWKEDVSMIQRYTQTGQLRLSKLYGYDCDEGYSDQSWLPDICDKVDEQVYLLQGWYVVGLYYKLEDVERFEGERKISVSNSQEKLLENPVPITSEEKQRQTHQGKILPGWKAIAEYLNVSESTAKRYSKGSRWLRHGPTGKPTTTTAELDAWQLSPPQKKKNKKIW